MNKERLAHFASEFFFQLHTSQYRDFQHLDCDLVRFHMYCMPAPFDAVASNIRTRRCANTVTLTFLVEPQGAVYFDGIERRYFRLALFLDLCRYTSPAYSSTRQKKNALHSIVCSHFPQISTTHNHGNVHIRWARSYAESLESSYSVEGCQSNQRS